MNHKPTRISNKKTEARMDKFNKNRRYRYFRFSSKHKWHITYESGEYVFCGVGVGTVTLQKMEESKGKPSENICKGCLKHFPKEVIKNDS